MASSLSWIKPFSRLMTSFAIFSLSRMPVRDTPNNASSSQFFFHSLDRYGKSVKDAWNVPRIVAKRTLRARSSEVSEARTMTSERLQNCLSRRMISEQGLVPNSYVASLRSPSFATVFLQASRLKMPRSPLLLLYKDTHSSIKTPMSGFSL